MYPAGAVVKALSMRPRRASSSEAKKSIGERPRAKHDFSGTSDEEKSSSIDLRVLPVRKHGAICSFAAWPEPAAASVEYPNDKVLAAKLPCQCCRASTTFRTAASGLFSDNRSAEDR